MLLLVAAVGAIVLAGRRTATPVGARDEVPVHAAEPAAPYEPKPAGNVAEGEASGGGVR